MNEPKLPLKQRGMSMLSWLVVLAITVFFILIGIKMVPTYLENYSIKQVLATMEEDRSVRAMAPRELKLSLMKRMKINSVYQFKQEWIEIKKGKLGTTIDIVYEVRKPVAGNVSIVMAFSESATIPPS